LKDWFNNIRPGNGASPRRNMIKYKLTDQNLRTRGGHQWEIGVEQVITKPGTVLCSNQVFHFYDSPELAILLNPIHADIKNPRLWEVDCDQVAHNETKGGAKKMKFVRELPSPQITIEQKIKFAILCAKVVCHESDFLTWADNWLHRKDRSAAAAWAAWATAKAAKEAVAAKAAWAAWAAAKAAAAAWMAARATAAEATAAEAAAEAARAAAAKAAWADNKIELIAIAQEACK
jgi:hypothetical protein